MLSRLSIRNYAIIDHLDVDFHASMNIITGETGAGKSIIVGALGLILGQRAESNVLFDKQKKCIVEGWFHLTADDEQVFNFLKEQELDLGEELVVRREIAPAGKSRAFINDTPVNLFQLNQLSSLLVDLHQQFDTLELAELDFQRQVLDALAGNFPSLKKYGQVFLQMEEARKSLKSLQEQKSQFEKEFDYHQFQFTELEEAAFKENELEQLEQELKMLANAEGIKSALTAANYELSESEDPVLRKMKNIINQLQQYADVQQEIPALVQRLQSAYIELQDIASDADRIGAHIIADASTVEKINERLSLGYRLLKKHGVKQTNDLLAIKNQLEDKLQAVLNIDEAIIAAEKNYALLQKDAEQLATEISKKRKAQVAPFEKQVNNMLAQVGMPNALLKVSIEALPSLQEFGTDKVEFLFDANKTKQFKPLSKVASGGELSRIMLCIKSLVATSMNLPTLIFDEIDTGISGEAAKQVGMIMKNLSAARQIISITHQPQIAGKADAHFLVFKEVKGNAVFTGVRLLNTDERIVAIARMLSGEKPTAAALENAREMVMN